MKRENKRRPTGRKRNHSGVHKNGSTVRRILILVSVVLLASVAVFTWHSRDAGNPSPTGGDSFSQVSADVPVYMLVVGVDEENPQQCNFIGVAAVNKKKKHIDIIMLPDNTKIEGRREKGPQTLASVYSEGGIVLVQAVVEDMFHVPVTGYAVFKEDAFMKLMDMNDGMNMYVEKNMYHADSSGTADINIFQGYQHLNSREALGYMRYLDSNGTLLRTQRQLRFVKLFLTARLKHFGIVNAVEAYRFWNNVTSNISAKDMARLVYAFGGADSKDISFYILPGESSQLHDDKALADSNYWVYDPIEVQKVIGLTNNALAADVATVPERPEPADDKSGRKGERKDTAKDDIKDGKKKNADTHADGNKVNKQ